MTQDAPRHPGLNLGRHHPEAHAENEKLMFGFWVFLMSDLILFGIVFATYASLTNPMGQAGGPTPRDVFSLTSAAMQTAILLLSSFTFGLASLALKYRQPSLRAWLAVTLLLGLAFLGLELRDLVQMVADGAVPQRSGWLSAFWVLVPLHGLHVAAGCLWLAVMLVQVTLFGLTTQVSTRLARLSLFWHFLDVVWIGVFSVVYLGGLA
ncbi:MAG: cytochrome o ubiquinol oxidase subunit III [Rhodobacteraceae bacterium]|nr:MAG: cytochrome o ubiquinol oxidase subunit III [Paracoccaceae bacterium]